MNWDWEKLQEKRQRQSKTPAPQGDGPENPFGGVQFGKFLPKFSNGIPVVPAVAVVLLLWLASGIFIVNPGEVGVVTRFGKYEHQVLDGPHYRLPFPIEASIIVNTQLLRTAEVGISAENAKRSSQIKAEESSMFTGDENIVHMQFNVQYTIADARKFLFHVKDPGTIVTSAAEAAMREVVGRSNIDSILTAGRMVVQDDARNVLETILKDYDIGVKIHAVQLLDVQPPAEVEAAFKDVASAREDKVRIINQAEAYRMEVVPVANGTAIGMLNAAAAYRQKIVQEAEGEAHRFLAMVTEFNKAKDITRKRMYLDAMGDVLSAAGMEKVIISKDAQGAVLPLLNLDKNGSPVRGGPAAPPAAPSSSTGQGPSPTVNRGAAR